jgi:hypothetical protein
MGDCTHKDLVSTHDPFSFTCEHCGVDMCTDCGTTPAHEDGGHYCRRCGEKGGHRYAFVTEIDHDKLRAKVGRELAEQILNECRTPW